jgi:hypothetical protein
MIGSIETVTGRIAGGWVLPTDGARSVVLDIYLDGQPLGTTVAFPAMGAIGGRLIFEVPLPAGAFDGNTHLIACAAGAQRVVLANEQQRLDPPQAVPGAGAPAPAATPDAEPLSIEGRLDSVSENGWCFGWARYPAAPARRAEVEFLVDDEVVGVALASNPRADVTAAGHGDGLCGFAFPLPFAVMTRPRDGVVVARDRASGLVLPGAATFRTRRVADAVQQIAELEQDLAAVAAALENPAARGADARAAALFRTVGAFFTALAATAEAGRDPAALRLLDGAVTQAVEDFPAFALAQHERPVCTLGLHADSDLAGLYRGLGQIEAALQAPAEIFLLDDGAGGDAPLAPLVVQNLRYLRRPGSVVARVNLLARLAQAPVVVLLPASATLRAGAAGAFAAFAEDTGLALLAARIAGPDGALLSCGMALTDHGPTPRGRGASFAEMAQACPVDTAAADAFALRREDWSRLGGLDESYSTLGPALADFALRAAASGRLCLYDPGFAITLSAGRAAVTAPGIAAAHDDLKRLDERRRSFDAGKAA